MYRNLINFNNINKNLSLLNYSIFTNFYYKILLLNNKWKIINKFYNPKKFINNYKQSNMFNQKYQINLIICIKKYY